MISRDIVVRIVQPIEKVEPVKTETPYELPLESTKDFFHHSLNVLGLAAITALGIIVAVGLFNMGIAWKEIAIMVGIPLALGLITSYSI